MFLGQLGPRELAAGALANIWTGGIQVLIFGVAVSICTLCGQAYGAQNYRLVGVWLQLAILFLSLLSVPVMISFFYVDHILSVVTEDQTILALADTYAKLLAPSAIPPGPRDRTARYDHQCGFGFRGAPIAQSVASLFQLVALVLYAFGYKGYHKKTWYGCHLCEDLRWERMRTFALLSTGMTLNLALDEWVYNVISALAGALGAWNLAATSILYNLWGLIYSIYWGFGLPTQVRVATFLGANRPNAAKQTLYVGFVLGGLTAFVSALFVYVFRNPLASLFTHDPMVTSAITSTMPIFCAAVFISGLHVIMSAVVEAMSLATTLVIITTIGSWVIMLPASYLIGLRWHGGLHGLWWGSLVGEAAKCSLLALALWRIDWQHVAQRAVFQSEGNRRTDADFENDLLLEFALPSTPMVAEATPVLAILLTSRSHQAAVDAAASHHKIRRSNSYGSVNADHSVGRR
ncbi:hypothetical protein CCR75_004372 [Bremia lactucae]|uniref:Multidrug/Oligosaccharidyl-lipid/Polysaccharide (MOP) Flippase Superfamily n=1 Tax=Bremia lactucae TaxID=4779 RepID=A0A976IDZ8_BRELC|nr:hypothetical protein CCR75_004372 [Bremia lactucae]